MRKAGEMETFRRCCTYEEYDGLGMGFLYMLVCDYISVDNGFLSQQLLVHIQELVYAITLLWN
jgi:hypothetical protein